MPHILQPLKSGQAGWQTLSVHLGREVVISLEVFGCHGVHSGAVALVVAGIHGDEYEGPSAVTRIAQELNPKLVSGTVWLIPVANPLAFEAGTRTSPVDGANLARLFPGEDDSLKRAFWHTCRESSLAWPSGASGKIKFLRASRSRTCTETIGS